MPVTGPDAAEAKIVPLVRPAKPPTMLLGPVLVTGPEAVDCSITAGPSAKVKAPTKPPSTLLPPPVTAPEAVLGGDEGAVAGAGKSACDARGPDGDVAGGGRAADEGEIEKRLSIADHAIGAIEILQGRIGTDQPAGVAAVAGLHVPDRGGKQDDAGVVADQAAGL